ncbi:MAG: hypothetical protein SXA11_26165, partial [Cyanobacteriota bacterium]|nr:hypothetical protein [Cyanobacteriota bacterium]
FTDLEETAEGENGSNFDDLVNSNVVDPNETELTATNIEESPSATESAEVEFGDVNNNDEVAAELEIEVPETDEVAEIENVAQELESEIEESPSATESAEGEIGN